MNTILDYREASKVLKPFVGIIQRTIVDNNVLGEEGQFFIDKFVELAALVEAMPHTRQTDGQGKAAIAHLHYFGGSFDAYVTEKDMGDPDDAAETGQIQAFGLRGFNGDLSLGYINIQELIDNGIEVDFYWTPKPLAEIEKD